MAEPSWIEVDLNRIAANVEALRCLLRSKPGDEVDRPSYRKRRGQRAAICGVVKKDAYGLGAAMVAPRLVKAGCEMLAVYHPDEAAELVHRGVSCPILLLSPLRELARTDAVYRHAVAGKLHLTIHDPAQIDQVDGIGRTFGIRVPVHLYLDTGMSRSGLNREQFDAAIAGMPDRKHLRLVGIASHLATADEDPDFAYEQLDRLEQAVADHADALPPQVMLHLANTFGLLRDRYFHLDMVRPGLGLYGYGPEQLAPGPVIAEAVELGHAVRWVSRVQHVQWYPRRTPVGYGSTHRLIRDSLLGVVPVGYADGYPVGLSNRAMVRVLAGDPATPHVDAKVLGRVNMDQIVIDLTDVLAVTGGEPNALMNSKVELISTDADAPNTVPRLAEIAKTNPYEILCRLSPRLKRRYRNGH